MTVFQEMGIESEITQPNSMILVSFSSVEDALFNYVKKYDTFRSQGTENPPFRSFGDTRYSRDSPFTDAWLTLLHICSSLTSSISMSSSWLNHWLTPMNFVWPLNFDLWAPTSSTLGILTVHLHERGWLLWLCVCSNSYCQSAWWPLTFKFLINQKLNVWPLNFDLWASTSITLGILTVHLQEPGWLSSDTVFVLIPYCQSAWWSLPFDLLTQT